MGRLRVDASSRSTTAVGLGAKPLRAKGVAAAPAAVLASRGRFTRDVSPGRFDQKLSALRADACRPPQKLSTLRADACRPPQKQSALRADACRIPGGQFVPRFLLWANRVTQILTADLALHQSRDTKKQPIGFALKGPVRG